MIQEYCPRVANLGEIKDTCVPAREPYNPFMHNNKCCSQSYSTRTSVSHNKKCRYFIYTVLLLRNVCNRVGNPKNT